jgi:DNA-binding CsgD family transcriptional regulator/PAS domain-containing protein
MTMATVRDRFAEVVDGLYDAAIAEELWPDALRNLASFTGGRAAALVCKDLTSKAGDVVHQHGAEQRFVDLYHERYWRLDPLTPLLFFPTGRPIVTADIMPVDEFRDGPFYREWALPQEFGEAINLLLDRSAMTTSFLSLIIGRGDEDGIDEAKSRTMRIAPHVRRAALVGQTIAAKASETAVFADTLDSLSAAIFLLRGDGGILHANAAARTLLSARDPLVSISGKLAARNRKEDGALASALGAAARGGGPETSIRGSLALTTSAGDCHVAHLLPITSGVRRLAIDAPSAVAALIVRKTSLELPRSPPEILARHYRLTPTELRVLLAIVEIGGARETAESLGIAETTAKTHLKHLYAKTGTMRQADLVKLVAGFASPLLN